MRTVRFWATWESCHEIEVEDDHPRIETLDDLIAAEDFDASAAALMDYDITDPGPVL